MKNKINTEDVKLCGSCSAPLSEFEKELEYKECSQCLDNLADEMEQGWRSQGTFDGVYFS